MSLNTAEYIHASNGNGEAVRAIIITERLANNKLINVDSVINYPQKFIATMGTVTDDELDTDTVTVFYGSLSGSMIHIDEIAPGYTDLGSNKNDVVLVKPATAWADSLANSVADSVPTSRTVNGHALSSNVTVSKSDIGLGNVTDDAQIKAVTSTDNALPRFNGTSGQVQNSRATLADNGNLDVAGDIYSGGTKILAAQLNSFMNRTWHNVSGSRIVGNTYTNNFNYPIDVNVYLHRSKGTTSVNTGLDVGGFRVDNYLSNHDTSYYFILQGIVPPGATYTVTDTSSPAVSLNTWAELY